MKIYLYALTFITAMLWISNIKFKIEKKQDLDFGNHFKPKRHFLFEHCAKCGKRLKHYHWFWGKGDFMGCEVDYEGNTKWFCEKCETEMNKNVLHKIPKENHCSQLLCHFIRHDGCCHKPDGELCPLTNIAQGGEQNAR